MSDTVVIYKSKYGFTKQYAQWISEELSADLFDIKSIKIEDFQKYQTIIYGGGIYAGGLNGAQLITKSYESIKNKNIVVFTCGLTNPNDIENLQTINEGLDRSFPGEIKSKIKIFNLRGGIDYPKLSFFDKTIMKMFNKILEKKSPEQINEDDKKLINSNGEKVDFTDKKYIIPIVSYVKSL